MKLETDVKFHIAIDLDEAKAFCLVVGKFSRKDLHNMGLSSVDIDRMLGIYHAIYNEIASMSEISK